MEDQLAKVLLRQATRTRQLRAAVARRWSPSLVLAAETRSANTWADLATVGPSIQVELIENNLTPVWISANIDPGAGSGVVGVEVDDLDGNVLLAPSDQYCLLATSHTACGVCLLLPTASGGLAELTLKYKGDGTHVATFSSRSILTMR